MGRASRRKKEKLDLNKVANRAVHEKYAEEPELEPEDEKALRLGRFKLKRAIQKGIADGNS